MGLLLYANCCALFGELRGYDQLKDKSKKSVQKAAQHYVKQIKEKGTDCKSEIKIDSKQPSKKLMPVS